MLMLLLDYTSVRDCNWQEVLVTSREPMSSEQACALFVLAPWTLVTSYGQSG